MAIVSQQDSVLGSSVHTATRRAAGVLAVFASEAGFDGESGFDGEAAADGPGEQATASRLAAVLAEHGEPEPVELSAADVAALRRAAGQLRAVFVARDAAEAADRINALLARYAHPPRLTAHGGIVGWHLHADSHDCAPWDEWFLTASCLALAVLLADRQAPPAGICASRACGKPFVNVGRGSTRRFCSPACGTRERVAAHRAKR